MEKIPEYCCFIERKFDNLLIYIFVCVNLIQIFKKIINGEMPCYKIFETEHSLAFLDAFPITPGHSLLVPKAPVRFNTQGKFSLISDICLVLQL